MKTLYHEIITNMMRNHREQHKIIDDILNMRPFIIIPSNKMLSDLDGPIKDEIDLKVERGEIKDLLNASLDVPFKDTFIEIIPPGDDRDIHYAFGITERAVGIYTLWYFSRKNGRDIKIEWSNNDGENDQNYAKIMGVALYLVEVLNRRESYLAKEKTGRKKSFREGKKKNYFEIRPITYVLERNVYEQRPQYLGNNIDWSHTFEVRGSWVQLSKRNELGEFDHLLGPDMNRVGKNRSGEYCVRGWTWRKEHLKGEGEFKVKTRIALTDQRGNQNEK